MSNSIRASLAGLLDAFRSIPLTISSCIFVCYIVLVLVANKYQKYLRKIPGPQLAGFTDLWRAKLSMSGRLWLSSIDLHEKYGSVVRTGPATVSISNTKYIPIIYNSKETFLKTGFYSIQAFRHQGKDIHNIFSTPFPSEHRAQKRRTGGAYSMPALLDIEESFNGCIDLLTKQLLKFSESGEAFDLGRWFQYFAFDVIGDVSFGRRLGFLEQGKDIDNIMEGIKSALIYFTVIGQIPGWHKYLLGNPLIPYLRPSLAKMNGVVAFTDRTIRETITVEPNGEITGTKGEDKNMLGRWARVKSSDPEKMQSSDIMVYLSTNVFAGSDTTAITLRSIFYYLCRSPEWITRVVDEIQKADQQGKLGEIISYKESTTHLPSIQAVIKEGFRMHPPTGNMQERIVPKEGLTVDGYFLPAGTIVGLNPWLVSRDPDIFYQPEEYRPERWLKASPEEFRQMETLMEFNFSYGARKCIGRNIAMIELTKLVPQILRLFRVDLAHPEKEWELEGYSLVFQKDLICRVKQRNRGWTI